MTVNVSSLRSAKVATPPCAAKAAIPSGLAVRKQHKMLFAASKFASYTATFYIVENDEKKVILSNSATDTTGSSVSFEGDLGQISGDGALIEAMIKDTSDWENNLYLELTTTDKSGTDNVYQLQMLLTEVTDIES